MSQHSVAEAKNHLSDLINRSLAGESVVITRHGQPVVELRPVTSPAKPVTEEFLAWTEANRVDLGLQVDSVTMVREMRDEGP
jgi:prevent-host-death family protein